MLMSVFAAGGYKGYGLAMMVEIFCGILSGGAYGNKIRRWKTTDRVANLVCKLTFLFKCYFRKVFLYMCTGLYVCLSVCSCVSGVYVYLSVCSFVSGVYVCLDCMFICAWLSMCTLVLCT